MVTWHQRDTARIHDLGQVGNTQGRKPEARLSCSFSVHMGCKNSTVMKPRKIHSVIFLLKMSETVLKVQQKKEVSAKMASQKYQKYEGSRASWCHKGHLRMCYRVDYCFEPIDMRQIKVGLQRWNKFRKLFFGSSNLAPLGLHWALLSYRIVIFGFSFRLFWTLFGQQNDIKDRFYHDRTCLGFEIESIGGL